MPTITERAARVWTYRERVEREASALFCAHAEALARQGCPEPLVDLAKQAGEDEIDHAERCRKIVDTLGGEPPAETRAVTCPLIGPRQLNPRDRALYVSVAVGCVTETLATALLIELRDRVEHPLVQETVTKILRDEVQHSRLGWGHLAFEAERSDVSWLGPHIGGMLAEATREQASEETEETLQSWGILNAGDAARCVLDATQQVILPGLLKFGVAVGANASFVTRDS